MKEPKNQRISSTRQRKQQHLLDVKIRVGKERERRFRAVAGFICKAVFVLALGAGAWLGGKEVWRRFVWENPDYFVREPDVKTDGTLTREQILTAADIVEGRNILTVDLGKSRAALEKLPQVESAEVQRTFPNRVAVAIIERRPIAWVTLKKEEDPTTSERAFLIDARGIILRSRVLLPEYYHLPIISGVETENLVPGQRVGAFDIQAALKLVQTNADSTRFQVRNIDLAKGYCLVVTDQRRAKITFGFDNIEDQLERLNRLLEAIEPTHQEIRTVNLIPKRNVPVTFFDPAQEAAAAEAAAAAESAPPKPEPKVFAPKIAPAAGEKTAPKGGAVTSREKPSPSAKKTGTAPVKTKSPSASPAPKASPVDQLKKRFDLNG